MTLYILSIEVCVRVRVCVCVQVDWLEKQAPKDQAKLQLLQVLSLLCFNSRKVQILTPEERLQLPPDTLSVQVRKAKFSCFGAAKYVMQMGLTASERLDAAAAVAAIPAKELAYNRNQVCPLPPKKNEK